MLPIHMERIIDLETEVRKLQQEVEALKRQLVVLVERIAEQDQFNNRK